MDPITTIQGRESGLIDVAAIERELAAMWRSASAERERGAVTRACRTNLIVLGGIAPAVLEDVTRRHPGRLITVARAEEEAGEGRSAPPLAAAVSALCHLRPGGGGLLCSERIAFTVGPDGDERLASAVRGLLIGELPVVLLGAVAAIRQAPASLVSLADRVLFDSTGAAPEAWADVVDATGDPARITDLAWLRLAGFRRAIAQVIARSPLRKAVQRLESVDIGHAARPTAAFLTAAWLGQRLRWGRPRRPRGAPGAAGAPAIAATPEPAAPRALEVSGRGRRVRLRFGVTQPPEDLVLLLRTPELEMRAALDEVAGMAHVILGSGRARLRDRNRRGGSPKGDGAPARREHIPIRTPALGTLIVESLEHRGLCDCDREPVFGRACDLAAAVSDGWRPTVVPRGAPPPAPVSDEPPPPAP
jgi:glucose-6-phosphate dehydrogenase assembly protein OpcA